MEDFLIAAKLCEGKGFHDPAKYLRDAALFKPVTGSIFVVEGDLPPLLVEAARIYAGRITLAKLTQVVFSVRRDHETMSISFELRVGTCSEKVQVDPREIYNADRIGERIGGRSGIIDRILVIIAGLNLQERLLTAMFDKCTRPVRFDNIVSDSLNANVSPGNSLASEDEIDGN